MNVMQAVQNGIVYFDGGTGTALQAQGLRPGERPEEWNLRHPDRITRLHRAYLEAGCGILKTNTFGVNRLRFGGEVAALVNAALDCAEAAKRSADARQPVFIALDIGPCGKLLKPLGELDFEDAVSLFAEVVRAGAQRADLILIETMNDAYETKAAVLAAKENAALPIFVTNVYDESGKLMTGADPEAMIALLEGLGVQALGMNCSLGPAQMLRILPRLTQTASVPVIVNPNAGLPREEDGSTVYDVGADEFAALMREMAAGGARILGGCCGTTPEYIRLLIQSTKDLTPLPVTAKKRTLVSSYTHAVELGSDPVLIGERINPTGKKRLKQALLENDADYILRMAAEQEEHGAQILDLNVGLPELDEPAVLTQTMEAIQEITALPLQLDSSDPEALARAMRRYNGKPLINSVNGKEESMAAVFPLVRRYGGTLIALTLDENGIPGTAGGRLAIADRILNRAAEYGIPPHELVFDPLAMTVSADTRAAAVCLDTVRALAQRGLRTSLGVSNVSFGLPSRETVTASFFAMAIREGLSAAIMNPLSEPMRAAFYTARLLCGLDGNCADYLGFAQQAEPIKAQPEQSLTLRQAIVRGLRGAASEAAKTALLTEAPFTLIQGEIIPALDEVGRGFEAKTLYLPQLLMSAEAASAAFDAVRERMQAQGVQEQKETVILATVRGDIHDIGKNIVKVLLQNYGYRVLDLGRDVPPRTILEAALRERVRLVGLSALMTTTVPAMEETIRLLHAECPQAEVMVGGAVLTQEYADRIGADHYAKDAMGAVRVAERCFGR